MGFMYKEVIIRKRLPVFIVFFLVIILILCLLKIAEIMKLVSSDMGKFVDIISLFILTGFGMFEFHKCRIKYKYSIIADQLIIHKIKGDEYKLVEDIRIDDIQYIGPNSKLRGIKKHLKTKKYICSVFNMKKQCCVYHIGKKSYKIYFEPSIELIEKVKCIKDRNSRFEKSNTVIEDIKNNRICGC